MKGIGILMAALLASSAQAQFVQTQDEAAPFQRKPDQPEPFSDSFHPYPRTYATNEGANPNDKLFKGLFKTDPRLLFGVSLTPNVALEAGYVNLLDRGFHRIEERDDGDLVGALGTKGFSIHAAVKYTVPLSERLSVFGKIGKAHSAKPKPNPADLERMSASGQQLSAAQMDNTDTGLYTGAGAKYKLNERTTITGEFATHGKADKWGRNTNSSGLRANLKMGF